MELLLLEVCFRGIVRFRELHLTKEQALRDLYYLIRDEWGVNFPRMSFNDYNMEEAIEIFFGGVPEYTYDIIHMDVTVPKPVAQNPWPDMDPVVMQPAELDLLSYCLGDVSHLQIREVLRKSLHVPSISPEFAASFVKALRKKLE